MKTTYKQKNFFNFQRESQNPSVSTSLKREYYYIIILLHSDYEVLLKCQVYSYYIVLVRLYVHIVSPWAWPSDRH